MTKRAFLVLGPPSSGTRLMTRLLIAAGCYGDDDHYQRLDELIPEGEPLIAWRRSVPHGDVHVWANITQLVDGLRRHDFETFVIVTSRDWHAMVNSQVDAPHFPDVETAMANIKRAYWEIFEALLATESAYEIVNYEALVLRPDETVRYLLQRIALPIPEPLPDIYDGNAKYYEGVAA